VLTIVAIVLGQMADALPLFDQALAVTEADPALTDLRLLLQINKAIALGGLDRYEEAFAAARQARHLADQAGTLVREVMGDAERDRLVSNIVGHLLDGVTEPVLQRAFEYWRNVDKDLGNRVEDGVRAGQS
jgi:tetratricopeptide (TPR) repeat protein